MILFYRPNFLPNPKDGSLYAVSKNGEELEVVQFRFMVITFFTGFKVIRMYMHSLIIIFISVFP